MKYFQLLRESLQIILENKLVWKFGFLAILANLFPPIRFFQNNSSFLCIGLIVLVILSLISTIGYAGLIFLVHQIRNNRETSFSDCWNHGKSKVLPIIGLTCTTLPLFFIAYYPFKVYYDKISDTVWPWLIIFLFSIFGTIIILGACSIVIDDNKVGHSWRLGLVITTSNFFHLIIVIGIFSIIAMFSTALVLIVFIISPLKSQLPSPLILNYSTYLELLRIPIFWILNKLFGIITWPWSLIVFVIIYERFTQKYQWLVLKTKEKAT